VALQPANQRLGELLVEDGIASGVQPHTRSGSDIRHEPQQPRTRTKPRPGSARVSSPTISIISWQAKPKNVTDLESGQQRGAEVMDE